MFIIVIFMNIGETVNFKVLINIIFMNIDETVNLRKLRGYTYKITHTSATYNPKVANTRGVQYVMKTHS